ncbi:MAG TPA: outer membrane beta-barrel protein [Gemmatimonadaceae bacterium]|nr:outer membrane beta-barrel protein [Gemmatimonadaceae bacterium]
MRCWAIAALSLQIVSHAPSLAAQRLLSIGLGGGVSVPQGDLSGDANTGWHALGAIVLSTPMQPLGLRADVAYNRFAFNSGTQAVAGGSGYETVGSATLNATYRLPMPGTPMSPYLLAGLGGYRTDCSLEAACGAATHFGWNAGLGTKLYVLGFRSFVEARYHRTSRGGSSVSYFPVTVGLLF